MVHRILMITTLLALSPLPVGATPMENTRAPGAAIAAAPGAAASDGVTATVTTTNKLSAPMVLVGVAPGTGQALLWKATGEEYVLVRVGESCQGFQLRRLFNDRVILTRGETSMMLALDSSALIRPGDQRREARGLPASIHTARMAPRGRGTSSPAGEPLQQNPRQPTPTTPPSPSAARPSAAVSMPAPAGADAKAALVPESIKLGEGVQVISLLSLRKEVSSFMHGLSPYRVNVSPSGGFLVTGIKAGTMLHTLGLEEGDEIISIGGIQVSSKEEALNAYLTFAPDREVELQLLRQGAPRTLSFRLSS